MRLTLLTVFCSCAIATSAAAQFRLQTQLGVELELDRRFSVAVAERAIWGEGIAASGRYRTMLGFAAEPTRYFSYTVGYQMYFEDDRRGRVLRHRLQADARIRKRFADFRVAYRLRAQSTGGEQRRWRTSLRNRLQIDLEVLEGFRVFGSAELYSTLNASALAAMRTEWGIEWSISRVELMLGYRYHAPWQTSGVPYHMVMLAGQYAWDFDL